jgi:hypothetical protein
VGICATLAPLETTLEAELRGYDITGAQVDVVRTRDGISIQMHETGSDPSVGIFPGPLGSVNVRYVPGLHDKVRYTWHFEKGLNELESDLKKAVKSHEREIRSIIEALELG